MRKILWLCVVLVLAVMQVSAQQGPPQVALVNASGQLVVAGSDGVTRWIITNPGETLNPTLGYHWSPDRMRLFFGVDVGGAVSLRIAEIPLQAVTEIGQLNGTVSGGDWVTNSAVQVSDGSSIYQADASGLSAVYQADGIQLFSPYAAQRPHIANSSSTHAPFSFFWQNGSYVILGESANPIPEITNESQARASGLWSTDGNPLVAYWGGAPDGNRLAVTHAGTLQTLNFSGSGTPPVPIAWNPGTTELLYRDATGTIHLADVRCLLGTCADNPLENAPIALPASATDIQITNDWAIFRENETVRAVPLRCTASNTCAESTIMIGQNLAPRTLMHVSSNRLVFTTYANDPLNPLDRAVQLIDDLGCLPNCQPRILQNNAISGLISLNGEFVVLDILGEGLHIVRISDGTRLFLTSSASPGAGLLTAQW